MVTLNHDSLIEILKLVEANADIARVSQTCRSSYYPAIRELLGRKLSFDDNRRFRSFAKFVSGETNVHRAQLVRNLDVNPYIYHFRSKAKNWVSSLVIVLARCTRLRHLTLGHARVLDIDARIGSAMRCLTELRSLCLLDAAGVQARDLVLTNLRSPRLVNVHIDYKPPGDGFDNEDDLAADESDINLALSSCAANLKFLSLHAASFPRLSSDTLRFPNVTSLVLRSCSRHDMEALMHAFPNLCSLVVDNFSQVLDSQTSVVPAYQTHVEPWKKLMDLEAETRTIFGLNLPCTVDSWTVMEPVDCHLPGELSSLMATAEQFCLRRLTMHMDLTCKEDLKQMVDNASGLRLTHLALGLNVTPIASDDILLLPVSYCMTFWRNFIPLTRALNRALSSNSHKHAS